MSTRREFLGKVGVLGSLVTLGGPSWADGGSAWATAPGPEDDQGGSPPPEAYELPPLPYALNALEPHLDEQTLRIHHDLHHAAYTKGLNETLKKLAEARKAKDYGNVQQLSRLLAFHGAGHLNHVMFWENMAPAGKGGGGKPTDRLADDLSRDFGGFDAFVEHFSAAAVAVEGNGWALLGYHPDLRRLVVLGLKNHQDLLLPGITPLLICDVWEHAYYLKYQNRRGEFVKAWWNVVNWKDVARRHAAATRSSA